MVYRLPIRTKLMLFALGLAAAGIIFALALAVLNVASRRDAVQSYLEGRAASVVRTFSDSAPVGPQAPLQLSVLQLVVGDPQVERAAIVPEGRGPVTWVPAPPPTVAARYSWGFDADALRLAEPLPNGAQLVLWFDEAQIYAPLWNELAAIGMVLAVVLLLMFLASGATARWIARPISELAELARSIPESGDLDVYSSPPTRDELGQLGAAFGEMLGKVERRERALEQAKREAELAAADAKQLAVQAQTTADALAQETAARERTQRQLEQAQKMEALGRLAGGVAHDFNNLLLVMGTYADELAKRLTGQDADSIAQIREAVRRATKLTQQLLSFSRQPRGEAVNVDVSQTLIGMNRLLQRLIGEDIALTVEGTDRRLIVRAPEGALESAVMNLVVNARDAMPSGGAIRVRMAIEPRPEQAQTAGASKSAIHAFQRADEWMMLSVEDDGDGMDEATKRRAFEPFFTTKPAGEGTGLGLTLVYALCQQLGGQVTVDSEKGKGTRIALHLPLSDGESGFSVDLPSMTPLPSEEGRILVAEDDPQVRHLVVRVLTHAGFVVESVTDGEQALERLRSGLKVDLVVSDVVMPNMGGLDMAQALRREGLEVPVLFISGYPAHPGQSSATFPPELPMLRKPFTAQALRRIVRTMLGRNPVTPPPFDPADV